MSPSPFYEQSIELARALSRVLGWSYFFCWAISSYPQILINYNRKSVSGLAIDYFTVNVLGFACYTLSSIAFLFSSVVRDEYARRHPNAPEPTVRWNDLAFAAHATATSVFVLSQFYCWHYKRDVAQRLSLTMLGIIAGCITAILIAILLVLFGVHGLGWIDVIYTLQWVKLFISVVKYVPQAWVNYKRKSTVGWSIENILLDLAGGLLSLAQLVLDSSLQGDWSGIIGNPVKFYLSQIAIVFDILFMTQHYILYPTPPNASPPLTALFSPSSSSTLAPDLENASSSLLPKDIEQGYGTASQSVARRKSLVEEQHKGVKKRVCGGDVAGVTGAVDGEERRGLLSTGLEESVTSAVVRNGG
ncbi:hypothetical protein RUND412_009317 [Rhizina undulata]